MDTKYICAYNLTRDAFLSHKVTVADAALEPLKVLEILIGGLGLDSESSLWLTPLTFAPDIPRLFPYDILYLDHEDRVLHCVEVVPGAELPPYTSQIASALILPERTLTSTHTRPGDQLRVSDDEELMALLKHIPQADVDASLLGITIAQAEETLSQRIPFESFPLEVITHEESPYEQFPSPLLFIPSIIPSAVQDTERPFQPPPANQFSELLSPSAFTRNPEIPNEAFQPPLISGSLSQESSIASSPIICAPIQANPITQFTVTQSPIWHISNPTIAVSDGKSNSTPQEKTVRTRSAVSSNQSPALPAQVKSAKRTDSLTRKGSRLPLTITEIPTLGVPLVESTELTLDKGPELQRLLVPLPDRPAEPASDISAEARKIVPLDATPSVEVFNANRSSHLPPETLAVVQQLIQKDRQRKKERALSTIERAKVVVPEPEFVASVKAQSRAKKRGNKLGKAKLESEEKLSLAVRFQRWLDADIPVAVSAPQDRRRSSRCHSPGLVAYYWSSGPPMPHPIVDISDTGFYLLTSDRWVHQTMLRMTLQRPTKKEGQPGHSIVVLAKVIRIDSQGVGYEFVLTESLDRQSREILPKAGTNRKALEQFL